MASDGETSPEALPFTIRPIGAAVTRGEEEGTKGLRGPGLGATRNRAAGSFATRPC